MPEYKKRRVSRFQGVRKRGKNNHIEAPEQENIEMSPSVKRRKKSPPPPEVNEFKVVKGKKEVHKRNLRNGTVSLLAVVLLITFFHLILPGGIIENIQNLVSLVGSGTYPIDINSSEVLNTKTRAGYYYILTDTRISAYSGTGKEIYSHTHGYENPIMKTSKTRAMVFSQGNTEALIFNLSSLKSKITTKKEIITANISDSGVYAIVTTSDSYASVVSVYNKDDRLIYEWSSSSDTVNNVAVSPNGKKIAVSLFNASSGKYNSSVKILTFDSASPKFTENFDSTIIYDLETSGGNTFSVLTPNNVDFINWSNYNKIDYKNDYTISMFRSEKSGSVALFNRSSDKTDNRIAVFTKKGQLKNQFDFKGIISDIEISGGHIYCISDTDIYILSDSGKVLRHAECDFGAVRLSVIGTNTVAVITDNKIEKIELYEGENQNEHNS